MLKNEAIFQTVPETCRTTGLSKRYLREGCKNGTVPHIKNGRIFKIDVPALLEQLRREEAANREATP